MLLRYEYFVRTLNIKFSSVFTSFCIFRLSVCCFFSYETTIRSASVRSISQFLLSLVDHYTRSTPLTVLAKNQETFAGAVLKNWFLLKKTVGNNKSHHTQCEREVDFATFVWFGRPLYAETPSHGFGKKTESFAGAVLNTCFSLQKTVGEKNHHTQCERGARGL